MTHIRDMMSTVFLVVWSGMVMAQVMEKEALRIQVIPAPKEVAFREGTFVLPADTTIVAADIVKEKDPFCVELLHEEIKRRFGLLLQTRLEVAEGAIVLDMPKDNPELNGLGGEGYLLDVSPSRVTIAANEAAGAFYGIQTLLQLIEKANGRISLPCLKIRDWPGLRYRGAQDDISRGPIPTMDYLKREIRTIASCKMNMFCLYVEHVFKFEKHPKIAPDEGHITAADIRELVAYAKHYHVEVLPQIQSFGHQYHILKHPEYADIREMPNGGSVFCPLVERTYEVIGDLYAEYAPCFECEFFHAGCDETQELGMGRSKEKVKEIGVAGVYLSHMKRLHEMLRQHGKRMMFWGDIALHYREMIPDLPKDIIVMNWTYGGAPSFNERLKAFKDAGLDQFVCPGVDCWSRMFPNYGNAVQNIQNSVRDGYKHGAMGMLNTTWDDDGENLFDYNWYGILFSAECAWGPEKVDVKTFDRKFAYQFYGPGTEDVVKAIWLLADTNPIPAVRTNPDGLFREDPFRGASPMMVGGFTARMAKIGPMAEEALRLIELARAKVSRNADNLDCLAFAAKRIAFTSKKFVLCDQAAKDYRDAFDMQFKDNAAASRKIEKGRDVLNQLANEVSPLREEYRRLWLKENRPYYLDNITARYDGLEKCLRGKAQELDAALAALAKGQPLPDPAALGFAERQLPRRAIKVSGADVKIPAEWWDASWHFRLPIKLVAGKADAEDAPVEITINFTDHVKGEFDSRSLRLIAVDEAGKATGEAPCQFVAGSGFDAEKRAVGSVVWMVEGKLPANSHRLYHLYFDTIANGPKPPIECADPVKTYDAENGKWIENSRIKVKLGEKSGVLFVWQVKALGSLDVTTPGESGWAGFGDLGHDYRDAPFTLECVAAGPVLVRYKAIAPDGIVKTYDFYRGVGWCDACSGIKTGYYWNFDNEANMSSESKTPGKWLMGNGESGDVGPPGKLSVGSEGQTTWCVKWRPDKLTIGIVSPDDPALVRVGPGGGMGGVGIDGPAYASHFVTFADTCDDPAAKMKSLDATLSIRNMPSAVIGSLESKD